MPLVDGFSRRSPVYASPSFRHRSIFTSINLIGSQDLAVKSRANLFTHSLDHIIHGREVKYRRREFWGLAAILFLSPPEITCINVCEDHQFSDPDSTYCSSSRDEPCDIQLVGNRTRFDLLGGEQSNHCTTTAGGGRGGAVVKRILQCFAQQSSGTASLAKLGPTVAVEAGVHNFHHGERSSILGLASSGFSHVGIMKPLAGGFPLEDLPRDWPLEGDPKSVASASRVAETSAADRYLWILPRRTWSRLHLEERKSPPHTVKNNHTASGQRKVLLEK
ncbi:hypothetical protein PR048_008830 [Dryococelus australis]|uniref:Uncharacterized protein n=1 Tax=Dryococelus australis TaxID=614101 RepID=A0ABQ9HY76_9NEOP|nr:hypothetical protein PR048_008830 [Dryococelus australis]